jgi:hypothetical protein
MEEKAMKRRFAEWMVKHSRRYEDEEEKAMRYKMLRRMSRFVDEHTRKKNAREAAYPPVHLWFWAN